MTLELSRHAKRRMLERKISKKIIEKALLNPSKIYHIENDKFICYSKINSKILKTAFIRRKDYYKIITVYYENNL